MTDNKTVNTFSVKKSGLSVAVARLVSVELYGNGLENPMDVSRKPRPAAQPIDAVR
jgi:hypothetical protein